MSPSRTAIPSIQAPMPVAASSGAATHRNAPYVDPFKVSAFTFKKVVAATVSLTVAGVPSALYTGVVAAELPEFLNLQASSLVKITLGGITIFGNAVCNTQQIYDTTMHILANRAHPRPETPAASLKYKAAVATSAISGAGIVAFIAAAQLQAKYPNYFILVPPAAVAAGAEFFLGGVPLHNVMFKQLPEIFFGSRISLTRTGELQLLENGHHAGNGYGAIVNDINDLIALPNQTLDMVFVKIARVLRNFNNDEKNTLMKLYTTLYIRARSNFQENPGLIFSTLLFGKIDKSHPLFKNKTAFAREEIVKLLNEPEINALLKKLRTEITKIELTKFLSGYDRARLASLVGVITFTCFSYLYDMSINLIKMLNSVPGGVALSLLGFPGFVMMCGLGVNLSRIILEKWDQTKWSEVPWTKVSSSILVGIAAAFLEATLCANMANHLNGLNWAFAIVGLVTKGFVINAPYAYRFLDASIYTLKYLQHRSAPAESVVAKIAAYAELLEHNAMQVSHADLQGWHEATDTFTIGDKEQVTIKPMMRAQTTEHVDFEIPQASWREKFTNGISHIRNLGQPSASPLLARNSDSYSLNGMSTEALASENAQASEQGWGSWLLGQARKPYEACGLICPRPTNRPTYTSLEA